MAQPFYIDKLISKPWETIGIVKTCWTGATITSSEENVAFVNATYDSLQAVGVWETTITMDDACATWYSVKLQVTEDGLSPFVNQQDYMLFAGLEVIFFGVIIAIATTFRLKYWLP